MAVTDESLHHATESLILSKPRSYYRAYIETSHWQLRSLISSPENHVVYYPNGAEIYALYTKSKERELITTLPFHPLCVVVAGGWLCCGGRHGNYATICLNKDKAGAGMPLAPDARLSLDLDSWRLQQGETASSSPSTRTRRRKFPLEASVKHIGHESDLVEDAINNCITLWFPTPSASEKAYKSPVAVIANNDKSVYLINLEDSEELERFTYPDCVNRAVMSPDGEILCAVLDDPFLYVHQRRRRSELTPGLFSGKEHYEWAPACRIQLQGQKHSDKTEMRGAFALAFSSSGKYLATATQHGLISIFEVATLMDEDAEPLSIFTSSRPGTSLGAVRAMEFCPGPFDLLAYTENDGKVNVVDTRTLFVSRQTLCVDSKAAGVERVYISEKLSLEPSLDPRLRSSRTNSPSPTPDYLLDYERRQARQMAREMFDRHQAPLTAEEMDVLEAHRVARRQRDALGETSNTSTWADTSTSRAATSAASVWTSPVTRNSTSREETTSLGNRRLTPGLSSVLREFVGSDRTAVSLRLSINERNRAQERERRNQDSEYRRRNTALLAAARAHRARELEAENLPSAASENEGSSSRLSNLERLTLTLPRLLVPGTDPNSNPWDEIDALYRPRYPEESTLPGTRQPNDIDEDSQVHRRFRLRSLGGDVGLQQDEERTIFLGGRRRSPSGAPETMGIAWSPDGRTLYVGADDGIYEYHVNISRRRVFPSIVLR